MKIPKTNLYISCFFNQKNIALLCLKHKTKPRWCLHIFVYKPNHWECGYRRNDDEYDNQINIGLGPLFSFYHWWEKLITENNRNT